MQLSLNGWPPVASHVTCLLLGMSLAHLSRGAPVAKTSLPPKAVALAVSPTVLDRSLPRGGKVHGIRAGASGGGCRWTESALTILEPGSVVAALGSSEDLGPLLKAWRGGTLRLVDAGAGARLSPCRSSARVSYGGR